MSSTNARTNEDSAGLQSMTPAMPALKPWDIAELPLFNFPDAQTVDVEHASDEQFEAWRAQNGIPAKLGAWSFERRCKAINMCRFYGTWDQLHFPLEVCAERNTEELDAQKCAESEQNSAEIEPTAQNEGDI